MNAVIGSRMRLQLTIMAMMTTPIMAVAKTGMIVTKL